MTTIGIMGNGPTHLLPDLYSYKEEVDIWIGADAGTLTLMNKEIAVDHAVGDFDSISVEERNLIKDNVKCFTEYPIEKDQTDIEIAIQKACSLHPKKIYIFGVTGGRLDHELINIQLLYKLIHKNIRGIIVDRNNMLELTLPNKYQVEKCKEYPYISFIPYSKQVQGLELKGFYYPLKNKNISWGTTLCISNELLSNSGTFSYEEGILLLIKSRDAS